MQLISLLKENLFYNQSNAQLKKLLTTLLAFECMRGLLIILVAWNMQFFIRNATLNILLILFVLLIARILIDNLRAKRFNKLSLNVQETLRQKLHQSIFSNSSKITNSGELLTLTIDTVEAFDDLFIKVLPNVLAMIVLVPMILIASAAMDPSSALIFLLTLPIAPFLLYLIGQAVSLKNQQAWTAQSKLNGDFKELLAAITTLKIFKQIEPALAKLKSTSEQSAQATLDVLKLAFVSAFALELITTLSIALIAVTVGLRLVEDDIAFETTLFLLILAPEFYSPIRQIGVAFHSAIKAKDAADNLKSYLMTEQYKIDLNAAMDANNKTVLSIVLNDVSFTYPNKMTPTLQHLNITFNGGKVTAVVGESGSGKSTLLKLIAGLYKPTEGTIKIYDDTNVEINIDDCGYVPQQPHLFKTSIRKNATLFKSADESQVKHILDAVGLNINLDDNVNALSRGQLQRLGLARALIKNAPILILDEPTAGLDIETEQNILKLLSNYRHNRTIIIATHRKAVIDFADEVITISARNDRI